MKTLRARAGRQRRAELKFNPNRSHKKFLPASRGAVRPPHFTHAPHRVQVDHRAKIIARGLPALTRIYVCCGPPCSRGVTPAPPISNKANIYMSDTSVLWEETVCPGRHLVSRPQTRHGPPHHRLEGGAKPAPLLQLRAPRRALQHARHPQGPAHRAPDPGFVLYSDMGRVLCSITRDTVGWHDTARRPRQRRLVPRNTAWPLPGTRNDCHKNAHEASSSSSESGGWPPRPGRQRQLLLPRRRRRRRRHALPPGNSKAGDAVELRAEMNVLVILNTCQHPLDPAPNYAPKPGEPFHPPRRPACRRRPRAALSRPRTARASSSPRRYFLVTGNRFHSKASQSRRRGLRVPGPCRRALDARDPKGQTFRIVDLEGNQAADTLFYNAHDTPTATARRTPSARRAISTSRPARS